jgi:hypothetical protein
MRRPRPIPNKQIPAARAKVPQETMFVIAEK